MQIPTDRPFRGSPAIARGLVTPAELAGPRFRRILRDTYVVSTVPDSQRLRIQAAGLRIPDGAVITGRSAAVMWGARMGTIGDPVEVIAPARMRSSAGISVRHGRVESTEIVRRAGVPIPTAVHTGWEIARTTPTIEAAPWIDSLASVCGLSTDDLVKHAEQHAGQWGCRVARATLELCDARAESPPESIVRVSLRLGGVTPEPTPQFVVRHNGAFVARVDLAWEAIRLALEYDGQWHADRDQLARDRERLRRLHAAGWQVIHVTRNDLRDLDAMVAMIRGFIETRFRLLRSQSDPLSDLSSGGV